MVRQILVVLRSNLTNLTQVPPRTSRKIMVLQVVTQVQIRNVPPTDVVVSLLTLNELVMLSNYMNSRRVRTD